MKKIIYFGNQNVKESSKMRKNQFFVMSHSCVLQIPKKNSFFAAVFCVCPFQKGGSFSGLRPTDRKRAAPEVWCTIVEWRHYYELHITASPGPKPTCPWVPTGIVPMLAQRTTPPGALGEPTISQKVLRGVLHPGDPAPAHATPGRALARITSGQAGYNLGLAMLCLCQWIRQRPPTRGALPWISGIPTANTRIEAGPGKRKNPTPLHNNASPAATTPSTESCRA